MSVQKNRKFKPVIFLLFGFFYIVAILLILYGGFVWMTSQGNRDQVDKAKKIITNAAIGLVIIFVSFSIAQVVVGVIMSATGVGGGHQCNPVVLMEDVNVDLDGCLWKHQCLLVGGAQVWGPVFKDNPFCGPVPLQCKSENITPLNGSVLPIKNVVVRAYFNQNVKDTTVKPESIVIKLNGGAAAGAVCVNDWDCASDECVAGACLGGEVRGEYTTIGSRVEFKPYRICLTAPTRRCFSDNKQYGVQVVDGVDNLFCSNGQDVDCTIAGSVCASSFTTGTLVDTTGPEIKNLVGQVCENSNTLQVDVRDDSQVSTINYYGDGNPVKSLSGAFGALNTWEQVPMGAWNPAASGYAVNSIATMRAEAKDADDNSNSTIVPFKVRAQHCCNGVLDTADGESGVDCGGADCDACGLGPPVIDYVSPALNAGDNDPAVPASYNNDQPHGNQG